MSRFVFKGDQVTPGLRPLAPGSELSLFSHGGAGMDLICSPQPPDPDSLLRYEHRRLNANELASEDDVIENLPWFGGILWAPVQG